MSLPAEQTIELNQSFTPRRVIGVCLLALLLTTASAAFQRRGPMQAVEGEGFCSTPAPCRVAALGAGFPLAFMVDDPQVSVPNSIHLGEDDFRLEEFLVDMLFYAGLGSLVFYVLRRRKAKY